MTMSALVAAAARGPDADEQLRMVRGLLEDDRLIPYLGPALIALEGAAAPASPEVIAAALHRLAPAPARIRTNMWAVAQFIESRRHRKTLAKFMSEIFAAKVAPNALQRALARLPLSLVVDAWYDDAFRAALIEAGRDFIEIQGDDPRRRGRRHLDAGLRRPRRRSRGHRRRQGGDGALFAARRRRGRQTIISSPIPTMSRF